jgi:phage major head subunit gpT-like protein
MASPNMSAADFAGALNKAIDLEFMGVFSQDRFANVPWMSLVQMTSSDGASEEYLFGREMPYPNNVSVADYIEYGLKDESYTLTNETHGQIMTVKEEVWKDDRHGYIKFKAQEIAKIYSQYLFKLTSELLTAGISTLCHDGQYFFDTDHGDGSQDNDTQSQSLATIATALTNLTTVIDVMSAWTDAEGKPIGANPTHILTYNSGATKWNVGRILKSEQVTGTANNDANPLMGFATHITSPFLGANTEWYLFDTSIYKPVLMQMRQPVETIIDLPTAASPFFKIRTDMRFKLGYGPWFTAIRGN